MNKLVQQSSLGLALGLVTALAMPSSAIAQNTAPQNPSAVAPAAAPTKAKPGVKAADASSKTTIAPGSHEAVEYKDPEDMTTRYRPGNNKTTALPPGGNAMGSPAGEPADAKKHVANVKYVDRQATVPALDAASKDAAKSKTTPPPSPNKGKQPDSATQDSKRANKVDSFTVKQ
jgi:hypothetical protein